MKIYNWIDHLFSTKENRRKFLCLVLIVFWIWQNIWQIMVFFQLSKLTNYESLLDFSNTMNLYTSSILLRCIFNFISHKGFTFKVFLNISLWEYIGLFLSVIYLISYKSKNTSICVKSYIFMLILSILTVIIGFSQGSLSNVILILKGYGIICLIVECLIIVTLLKAFITKIDDYVRNICVHEM